ncbi:methyltransferase domain-containing protein [Streptomyces sp. NPDC000994]
MREHTNVAPGAARHWSDHHDRWNAINKDFNQPLLEAAGIGPVDRVLDIGCGAGQATRFAAKAAFRGAVLGLDISGPMPTRARAQAAEEGLDRITFEQGNAQIHPLPASAFDVAISRFGASATSDATPTTQPITCSDQAPASTWSRCSTPRAASTARTDRAAPTAYESRSPALLPPTSSPQASTSAPPPDS